MLKMRNETYDILRYIAGIVMPAFVVLYSSLTKIWNLPYGLEVSATISAIAVFLNACLKVSSNQYAKEIKNKEEKEETEEGK